MLLSLSLLTVSTPERIGLEGAWRLTQVERKIVVPATVPGVVQTDLMRAKLIPDPYFSTNEKKVQWVSDLPWSYSRHFTVPAAFMRKRRIVLRCEGIDTYATVRINGREVARPDNFFRTWEFDVKPFLKAGENTIQVDFETLQSVIQRNKGREARFGKPEQEGGKPYLRKAAFQGGWDFAPKLLTMGIWRPIGLVGWDAARLTDVGVAQDHTKAGQVGLHVKLAADTAGATTAVTTVLFKGRKVAEAKSLFAGGHALANLTVRQPQLWWPNEMGPQNLYDVRVELRDTQGRVVDHGSRRIGLRTVTWIPKTDKNPLGLVVNGRRFFAKGSNWVPYDSLLRENPAKERALVQKAADAHMNLLRVWGGGYYQNDAFFDACDEKGVLAWFEFGYADSPYPSFDPEWLADVRAEAEDAVRRTRNHPSIAVYSGNNEVIDRVADKTSPWQISREDYTKLFRVTLRDVVHEFAPDAAYTPGSPEIGDDHYWDVWHGSATFASYRQRHGFMSEYGFQAFPVPESVEQFTTPAERTSVETPAMLQHQKNWRDGNALIAGTALRSFRKPKDFDSTLWIGQIQQDDGILTGVEHWRRDWPRSTASLVWQFNDPWPVTSWSMIDYYGRPKALYYGLKRAYAPVALSGIGDASKGTAELWVVNDRARAKTGRLDWTLTRTDGTVLKKGRVSVPIPAGTSSVRAAVLDLSGDLAKQGATNVLLWGTLRTAGEPDSSALITFVKPKELTLADPELKASVVPDHGAFRVTVASARPALWSWVEVKGLDAQLSDNFIHVRAGQPATIVVRPRPGTSLAAVRKALRVRSLFDTYLPGTEATPVTRPDASGTIVATAEDAEILGETAVFEPGLPGNIGNWTNPKDGLRWKVRGAQPGTYSVEALVSIPDNEAGSRFEIAIDGQKASATVPGTGGWTNYRTVSLGVVRIENAGDAVLTLSPTSMVKGHVMNLRSVTLKRK